MGLCLSAAVIGGQDGGTHKLVLPQVPVVESAKLDALLGLRRTEARRAEAVEVGDGRATAGETTPPGRAGVPPLAENEPRRGSPVATGTGCWIATRYGDGRNGEPDYTDGSLGCLGAGEYDPARTDIIAVSPWANLKCGADLYVCVQTPAGRQLGRQSATAGSQDDVSLVRCIVGTVMDSCPGCGPRHIDVSECSMAILAGLDPVLDVQGRCVGEHFPTADYLEVSVEVLE